MNKNKIFRASKALWALEKAQDNFNEAVGNLSDSEVIEWAKQNDVTIEPSEQKQRIQKLTLASSDVTEHKSPETKGGCDLSLGAVSHDQPHSIPLRDNSFVQPLAKETKE
jgi:hypothetical protein